MPALRYFVAGATALDIGACLLLAMTVGFVTADHLLPQGKTIMEIIRL